jgi:hypothetical protein
MEAPSQGFKYSFEFGKQLNNDKEAQKKWACKQQTVWKICIKPPHPTNFWCHISYPFWMI